ncbi:hypothetical protein EYF80_066121 [Liparis tanakae]|uniref:Uncharacterized protein n=1 Tax=Liparis tanakae TaxID=230148 RepID=A0A4Z2E4T0_9TELE|nr:hypothetical protein EYF80_066121 [Liparis tanakae]
MPQHILDPTMFWRGSPRMNLSSLAREPVSAPQLTCHPISLSGSRQVVLFAVMRLPQLEEVLQAEELAHALPDGAARHQPVPCVVHQQQLVHVIGRQLQHSVHGAHEHLTCPPVDGQVSEGGVKGSVHHPARRRGGGRGRSSRGGEEGGGEEEEGEEEEEEERRRRGGHGGQREEEESRLQV